MRREQIRTSMVKENGFPIKTKEPWNDEMKQLNHFHAHIQKSPLHFRKEPSCLPKEPLIRSISWPESSPPYLPPRVWPCRCSLNVDPSVSGSGPQSGGSSYLKKKKDFFFYNRFTIISVETGWYDHVLARVLLLTIFVVRTSWFKEKFLKTYLFFNSNLNKSLGKNNKKLFFHEKDLLMQ